MAVGQGEGTQAFGEKAATRLAGMQMQRQVFFYASVWRFQRPGMFFVPEAADCFFMPVCRDWSISKINFVFLQHKHKM